MSGERQPKISLVRLGGEPGPGFRILCLLVLTGFVLAVWKPWADHGGAGGAAFNSPTRTLARFGPSAGSSAISDSTTVAPTPGPDGLLPACSAGVAWRVFAFVRDLQFRSSEWIAVDFEPDATGPTDPAIPVVPIADQQVMAVGFCTDYLTNPGRQVSLPGFWSVEGGRAVRLRPVPASLTPEDPAAGIILGPPLGFAKGSNETLTWRAGRYVFELNVQDGGLPARDLWFGVQVIASCPVPATPGGSRTRTSPPPSASPVADTC